MRLDVQLRAQNGGRFISQNVRGCSKSRCQLRAINLPKQATFRQLIAAPNQKIR
jgi:hypothetical protein